MFRELRDGLTYPKAMIALAVLTVMFGVAVSVAGSVFLPFSASLLALLFIFENPKKRYLSFTISSALIIICFIFNGIYSVAAIETVAVATLMSVLYAKKTSKGEAAFYLTATVFVLEVLAIYLSGAKEIGSFDLSGVAAYYEALWGDIKTLATEAFTANINVFADASATGYYLTAEDFVLLLDQLILLTPAVLAILCFAIVGFALKMFCFTVRRICKYGLLKCFSFFGVSNLVSYFYIAVAVLSFFASEATVIDATIMNLNAVLVVVFAYIGLKYLLSFAKYTGRRATIYIGIALLIGILGASAFSILSYLGVFISITINKKASANNSGDENKA